MGDLGRLCGFFRRGGEGGGYQFEAVSDARGERWTAPAEDAGPPPTMIGGGGDLTMSSGVASMAMSFLELIMVGFKKTPAAAGGRYGERVRQGLAGGDWALVLRPSWQNVEGE